jgi:phosphate transport system substrate-binding protein
MNNIGFAYNPKTLKPNSGIVIVPIDINNNGKIDADENFYADQKQLAKAIAQGKYPSPPARNLYLVTKGKPTNPVVKAFLEYILTKGEKNIEKQGYIQIDQAKIDEQLKLLR